MPIEGLKLVACAGAGPASYGGALPVGTQAPNVAREPIAQARADGKRGKVGTLTRAFLPQAGFRSGHLRADELTDDRWRFGPD